MERSASAPMATEGQAFSVQPSRGGLSAATSTTAAEFKIAAGQWVGRYVEIVAEGADLYFLWAPDTGATIDETATASDAATPTNNAPNFIAAGTSKQQLVSAGLPYLRFKAKAGTGYVRVFRS